MALCDDGAAFTAAIAATDAASIERRYQQERSLFAMFSNGFSAFESYFYGMFAIGAILQPGSFPLKTEKDQQNVSPTSTNRAYERAFPADPILTDFRKIFDAAEYREWREIRNILTHRAAPGRTIYVSIDTDEDIAPRWKINNISLDASTAATWREHAATLLGVLTRAAVRFCDIRIP